MIACLISHGNLYVTYTLYLRLKPVLGKYFKYCIILLDTRQNYKV